ncbi:hypothetical protein F2Q68_00020622 [Brassica cretica]|uniref:Uncharacterized protein n=2 Tax=Brassica cretica TaxID=69181 RepID=A0ABQ7EFQ1_BRACR|nr:hypothetical protein F2Q68_00020622 [Brassica cretica]KAF3595892.1 hypothetical protein DY000_02024059 [Brassica cretica]
MSGCMSRTHAGRHHSYQMSGCMTGTHARHHNITHGWPHASVACAETPRAWSIHLVLLHVKLHVQLPRTVTPRASVDTQLAEQLTPRSDPMQRATSSFSVCSSDFDYSGEFSSRDQSQIFSTPFLML